MNDFLAGLKDAASRAWRSYRVPRKRKAQLRARYLRSLQTRDDYALAAFRHKPLMSFDASGEFSAVENRDAVELAYLEVCQFLSRRESMATLGFVWGLQRLIPAVLGPAACVGVAMAMGGWLGLAFGAAAGGIIIAASILGYRYGYLRYKWAVAYMPAHVFERAEPYHEDEWAGPWVDTGFAADLAELEEVVHGAYNPAVITGIVEMHCHRLLKVDERGRGNFYPGPTDGDAGIEHAIMRLALPLGWRIKEWMRHPHCLQLLEAKTHTMVPIASTVTYNWIQDELTIGEEKAREEVEQEGGDRDWVHELTTNADLIIIGVSIFVILAFGGDSDTIDKLRPLLEATPVAGEATPVAVEAAIGGGGG